MTASDDIRGPTTSFPSPGANPSLRMMVVGTATDLGPMEVPSGDSNGVIFVSFSELTQDVMEDSAPDVVLSALMGRQFDAIDLALKLAELGFTGQYRAVSIGLQNPDVILAEVRSTVPNIDFDLFQMDAD